MPTRTELSRDELWFLDIAVRGMPTIGQVADSAAALRARFNVNPHSLSKSQVAETLWYLYSDGYLFFADDTDRRCTVCRDDLIEVAQNSDLESDHLRFGLTEFGGVLWERAAMPDWNRFYKDYYEDGEDSTRTKVSILATTECRLMELIADLEFTTFEVDVWTKSVIEPWQATYWKQLPAGVQAIGIGIDKQWSTESDATIKAYLQRTGRTLKVWRKYAFASSEGEELFR
jgi:hypothetical protein